MVIDPTGAWTPEQALAVLQGPQAQRLDPKTVQPMNGTNAIWLLVAPNREMAAEPWVLSVPVQNLDLLELHELGSTGWRVRKAGDLVPRSDWDMASLLPAVIWPQANQGPALLRVQHSVRWVVPVQAASLRQHEYRTTFLAMGFGAYLGVVLLVIALALNNALGWRQTLYLDFALLGLLSALVQMSATGIGGLVFWPDSPTWADLAPRTLIPAAVAACAWFTLRMSAPWVGRPWRWALALVVLAGGVLSAAALAVTPQAMQTPIVVLSTSGFALCLVVSLLYARQVPGTGVWLTLGWLCLLSPTVLVGMRTLGWLVTPPYLRYEPQIGAALMLLCMWIGLQNFSQRRRDIAVRSGSLAFKDALTGLPNEQFVRDRLAVLLEGSRLFRTTGAVLRVEINNDAELMQQFGAETRQAALLRVAEVLTSVARDGDTVARFANNGFLVVFEGLTSQERLERTSTAIVAKTLQRTQTLPPSARLRVLVAGVRPEAARPATPVAPAAPAQDEPPESRSRLFSVAALLGRLENELLRLEREHKQVKSGNGLGARSISLQV